MAPEDALAAVPGWSGKACATTALDGGLSNRSFRVDENGESYVLRLDAPHTATFGLDRQTEMAVLKLASAQGLAPAVIYADAEQGILLRRFISGKVWRRQDLDDPGNIASLGLLLRKVHAMPACGVAFDAVKIATRYADSLGPGPGRSSFAARCLEVVSERPPAEHSSCCHNDVVAENVVASTCLMLIDWEYACDNDPLFDLASLIGYHDLPERTADRLMQAYAPNHTNDLRKRLAAQIRLYDAMHWLWLASRQSVSPDSHQAKRLEELRHRISI